MLSTSVFISSLWGGEAFKDKRKVEFSIYGGTILHNMLHAEKKLYMTEWSRREKIVLCLKPEVKLYGT